MHYIKYYLIFDEFSVFIAYFSSKQIKSHKFIIQTEDDLVLALKKINHSVYYTYFTQCDFIYYLKDSYSRKTIDLFISDYLSPEIKSIKNFKITEVNYEEFELQIKIDIEQIKLSKLSKKDDDFRYYKNIKTLLDFAFNHYNGVNTKKNINKAIEIFEKCAEFNSIKAARFLANYYTKVCKNSEKALKYFNIFESNIDYDKKFYSKRDFVFVSKRRERVLMFDEKIKYSKNNQIKSITKYLNGLKFKRYNFNKNESISSIHKFEEDFLYEKIYFDENKNIKATAIYKKGFDEYDKVVLVEKTFDKNNEIISHLYLFFSDKNKIIEKMRYRRDLPWRLCRIVYY